MTEADAKTKVCCGPIPVLSGLLVSNRSVTREDEVPSAKCIGSACMAWRTAQVGRVMPGDEYATYRTEGYCGLAGAVQ